MSPAGGMASAHTDIQIFEAHAIYYSTLSESLLKLFYCFFLDFSGKSVVNLHKDKVWHTYIQ